ncbi:hypothetical protein COV06_00145 [Candidatus Uhrbacteria bacterium CG10_big_fil_rev_8_21_14_0_10_50_16]|uniref:DUF8128 domain-containing protein n=1 Tax=Candidatus Uhrbacteria bacterium CG10_big_fil_rev_8_21_14_0_10_50_16 TaxID=1975039 RepID=A0A2H0RMN3_9BACT|nr:MAG: hypothetical protein COV06_00145 [Candidatus Uhrbacteria bacterium CG10_big_fil_rev_8_21_14_0_10_50_16]
MFEIVTDFSSLQRMAVTRPDVLLLYILMPIGALLILTTIVWVIKQLYLDKKGGEYAAGLKWSVLAIDIPMNMQSPKAVENIFAIVKGTKSVVTKKEEWLHGKFLTATSFEIVSIDGYTQFFLRTQARFRDHLEAGIYSQYPEAEISEVEDYTKNIPGDFPNETHEMFGGEIILEEPSYLPIRTYEDFEHMASKDEKLKDPLNQMFEFMGKLRPGEQFWVHLIVHPGGDGGWSKKGEDFILKTYGRDKPEAVSTGSVLLKLLFSPFGWIIKEAATQLGAGVFEAGEAAKPERPMFFVPTNTEKTQLDGVTKKLAKPGYECKIRWAYVSRHETYNKGGRNTLWKGYLALFTHPAMNKFKYDADTMPRDDYFWMIWEYRRKQRELMEALKGRSWGHGSTPMYLNVEELATLWHFPTIESHAPLMARTESKRSEAPTYLPKPGVGESEDLPSEELIEVDEQGRPVARPVDVGAIYNNDLADILPTEPMIEPGDENQPRDTDETYGEEQPFIPPNLPV